MCTSDELDIRIDTSIHRDEVLTIYEANGWSAAHKPDQLLLALRNSHSLVTARHLGKLVGLGNAISDGHLVVYYPHLLVHPDYQGRGIGRAMMEKLMDIYGSFHQQMLTADKNARGFYEAMGFVRAGQTEPMWIYAGNEH